MPNSENKVSSPPQGRHQTDKSLSAERAKTDESLSERGTKTERQADEAVSKNRAKADKSKSVARHDADDTKETDKRLLLERQHADEALETERRHMDSVLERERRERKAVQDKLFLSERKETDKNLTDERNQTDSEALHAAKALMEEKTSHVATRAALTTRDEFLAIVSHDLKNPLAAISMAASLLSERLSAHADEETHEYLDLIERNANEAVRLITDLLDMEAIAAGKLGLQLVSHDLCNVIEHSAKSFHLLASAKNITLQIEPTSVDVFVPCDRDRILQVLSNLLGNAVKFTPKDGSITIMIRPRQIEVQVSIADTGPGIPENMQKTIFERFWQISKNDRRGLGLGLYVSTMIVEAHGGKIWVESNIGEGSTFHFTLPVSRA